VDRLHVYSITSAISQVIFVGALLVVSAANLGLSAGSALVLKSAGVLVGGLALAAWLRPVFHGARQYLPLLVQQAREWGFKVYVGRVLAVGTYNLDVLILGALTDAESVGFYTLAGAIAYGVGLPVTGLASTIFPRMARGDRLRREWLAIAWVSGGASIVGAWFLAEPVIGWVFSDAYKPAAALVVPLVLGQTIRGVTSIYNSYFSAHALGKELRDANIVLTVSNLILNFVLIPPFGAMGAAWASVLALLANFAAHVYGYRRSIRSTTPENSPDIT
jgi:O-antigen/teichoic acid export membrane protein